MTANRWERQFAWFKLRPAQHLAAIIDLDDAATAAYFRSLLKGLASGEEGVSPVADEMIGERLEEERRAREDAERDREEAERQRQERLAARRASYERRHGLVSSRRNKTKPDETVPVAPQADEPARPGPGPEALPAPSAGAGSAFRSVSSCLVMTKQDENVRGHVSSCPNTTTQDEPVFRVSPSGLVVTKQDESDFAPGNAPAEAPEAGENAVSGVLRAGAGARESSSARGVEGEGISEQENDVKTELEPEPDLERGLTMVSPQACGAPAPAVLPPPPRGSSSSSGSGSCSGPGGGLSFPCNQFSSALPGSGSGSSSSSGSSSPRGGGGRTAGIPVPADGDKYLALSLVPDRAFRARFAEWCTERDPALAWRKAEREIGGVAFRRLAECFFCTVESGIPGDFVPERFRGATFNKHYLTPFRAGVEALKKARTEGRALLPVPMPHGSLPEVVQLLDRFAREELGAAEAAGAAEPRRDERRVTQPHEASFAGTPSEE